MSNGVAPPRPAGASEPFACEGCGWRGVLEVHSVTAADPTRSGEAAAALRRAIDGARCPACGAVRAERLRWHRAAERGRALRLVAGTYLGLSWLLLAAAFLVTTPRPEVEGVRVEPAPVSERALLGLYIAAGAVAGAGLVAWDHRRRWSAAGFELRFEREGAADEAPSP